MKPFIHAKASAKKFGGSAEDYLDIHRFMDSSKSHVADVRHRALFHNSFGPFICEQVFGVTRINSDGKEYSVRDIAEAHILEDLGQIPTVQDWLQGIKVEPWMSKPVTSKRTVVAEEDIENPLERIVDLNNKVKGGEYYD